MTTTDPTEIALEALAKGQPPPSAALALVLEQKRLVSWQLANERAAFILRLCGAVVAAAAVLVFVAMVWTASQSKALVIEPFSVPPDLAASGLTGQVVASRVLDRMVEIQGQANSIRAASSFARAWDGGIEVQIPSTGVTLGDVMRLLRGWLGQDRHISGEVVQTPAGLSIAVRTGEGAAAVIEGPDAEVQVLLQRAGEAAFGQVEPYRYSVFLRRADRLAEAQAVLRALVKQGTASEQGWGNVGLGNMARDLGDHQSALQHYRAAGQAAPWQYLPWLNLSNSSAFLGDPETARTAIQKALKRLNRRGEVGEEALKSEQTSATSALAMLEGDYFAARNGWSQLLDAKKLMPAADIAASRLAWSWLGLHEFKAAQGALAAPERILQRQNMRVAVAVEVWLALAEEDWPKALALADKAAEKAKTSPATNPELCSIEPFAALAMARLGDLPAAQARLQATPEDCYNALIVRGRLAEFAGDPGRADQWFGRAVARAPNVPFAQTTWGEIKLARGDLAGALTQAEVANRLAPRFADPLKLIGDVRLARGDVRSAAEAYAKAADRAPRWGGLFIAWGEAQARQGQTDQARRTWRAAGGMDLSTAEQARLKVLLAGR